MKLISILSGKYFGFNTLYSNQSSSLGHWASRDVAHEGDVVVSLTRLAPLPPSPCVPLLLFSASKLAGADNFLDNSVDSDQVLLYHQENCYPANKIHNLLLHKNWRTHLKISFLSSAISVLSCINGNIRFLIRYFSQLTRRGWGRGWRQAGWSEDNAHWPALNTCPKSSPSPRPPSKQLWESPPVINVLD